MIDIHEEPFALATAEILLLRRLRRQRAPYVLYSAQNIDKRYPPPFRWLERWALRHAAGLSVCNSEAGRICERKGLPGPATLIPLGVDVERFSPAPAGPLGRHRAGRRVRRPARAPQGRRRPARGGRRARRGRAPRRRRRPRRGAVASPPTSSGPRRAGRVRRVARPGAAARLLPRPRRPRRPVASRRPAGSSSSGAWSSRRWRAACRSSPATPARCPTSSATPGCWCRPATRTRWPSASRRC